MTRTIAFGCDQAAFANRQEITEAIKAASADIEVVYMGPTDTSSVDYPDYAVQVATAVATGAAEKGILICGTGIGMSIAANKVNGVRAALCHDHVTAALTREHNDANVLCAGSRVVGMEVIKDMILTFLTTPFSDAERHCRRIEKITALEKKA